MLTGRKLLLADDSAAVRKVIELTFADEGMEVFTVGDGRSALERFEQILPDLVLADVYMPEIDGYELCRTIKQDARFAQTPVVLLISSFEPFDEAEARRAGADDVVSKPFQSIRQLVSRVGSLLDRGEDESASAHQYATLGISQPEPVAPTPAVEDAEEQVTVLVEAPMMEHVEAAEPAGASCPTDMDLLTADTMKLEPIVDEPVAETDADQLSDTIETTTDEIGLHDTIEVEPVPVASSNEHTQELDKLEPAEFVHRDMNEPITPTPQPLTMKHEDAVLDLEDEYLGEPQMVADDVFLDLDLEADTSADTRENRLFEEAPAAAVLNQTAPETPEVEFTPMAAFDEWQAAPEADAQPSVEPIIEAPAQASSTLNESLSPAAIDAIARRMVEQMSDKVVREIAWEVVPELSELLIKQKLEESK